MLARASVKVKVKMKGSHSVRLSWAEGSLGGLIACLLACLLLACVL